MMRYAFVDEVVSIELASPPRIEVAKTFAEEDDLLTGPSGPERVADSLLIELGAMTAGHLIFQVLDRRHLPLLLKVKDWQVDGGARPGERLTARAQLSGVSGVGDGAHVAEASVEVHGPAGPVGRGQLVYVCLALADLHTLGGVGAA